MTRSPGAGEVAGVTTGDAVTTGFDEAAAVADGSAPAVARLVACWVGVVAGAVPAVPEPHPAIAKPAMANTATTRMRLDWSTTIPPPRSTGPTFRAPALKEEAERPRLDSILTVQPEVRFSGGIVPSR